MREEITREMGEETKKERRMYKVHKKKCEKIVCCIKFDTHVPVYYLNVFLYIIHAYRIYIKKI